MKALRFHKPFDMRIENVDAPGDPVGHEVRVRVLQCGICGSDVRTYNIGLGAYALEGNPPQIIGHEFSAVVDAIGPDVTSVAKGDRVAIIPHVGNPTDPYARRGLAHISYKSLLVGFNWAWGGMSEYATVPETNVVLLPDGVSDEEGALFEPTAVALNAVDLAKVQAGMSVLVTGAGPIGALVAMCAIANGATKVFVLEPNASRRERIAQVKDVVPIDPNEPNFKARILQATEGHRGVDIAIECAAQESALSASIELLRPAGALVIVGIFKKTPAVDMLLVARKALTITGAMGFPNTIGPRVVELIASKRVPAKLIISSHVSLADAVAGGFKPLCEPDNSEVKVLLDVASV